MQKCPGCERPLTPFKVYDHGAMRCLGCRKAQLSATLFEWMMDPKVGESLPDLLHRNRRSAGPNCSACQGASLKITLPVSEGRPVPLSVCTSCKNIWIEETGIDRLPLRPREILEEEASRNDPQDRAMASKVAPEDPLVAVLSSHTGLPFVENVPPVKRFPKATLLLILLSLFVARWCRQNPALQPLLALDPQELFRQGGANLVSYFFVQPDPLTQFAELYFLWLFGAQTEQRLGPVWLLVLLALSTASGGVLHASLFRIPLTGASAGVAGLGMFFALTFPYARVGLPLLGSWMRFSSLTWILAWGGSLILTAFWNLKELQTEFTLFAPIGGAAAGFFFWVSGIWHPSSDRSR